jgi:hypothetical protein
LQGIVQRENEATVQRFAEDLVELSGIELEPRCGRLSPQAKS